MPGWYVFLLVLLNDDYTIKEKIYSGGKVAGTPKRSFYHSYKHWLSTKGRMKVEQERNLTRSFENSSK